MLRKVENCIDIIKKLHEVIFSKELLEKYRLKPTNFTRNRKGSFGDTIVFMVNFIKKSIVVEIDNFVQYLAANSPKSLIHRMTGNAFRQKRQKINPGVFQHLSDVIIEHHYRPENKKIKRFRGLRVLAVDGSKINLPCTEGLREAFGEAKNNTDAVVVQGISSVLYDVLNQIVLDGVLENSRIGERELALLHRHKWEENDLIIYDRGYPSYNFQYEHVKNNVNYLIRASLKQSNAVIDFIASGEKTAIVDIKPSQNIDFTDKDYDENSSLRVRFIRVDLPDNNVEVLITSLLDIEKFPNKIFKELYFLRWNVESFYDELKNKLKLEHFSGYSKNTILQDFYCAVFISNLQSVIVNDLDDKVKEISQKRRLNYKINTNISYGLLKNRIIGLLFIKESIENIYRELSELFLQNLVPIRENRSFPRKMDKYRCRKNPKTPKNQRDAV